MVPVGGGARRRVIPAGACLQEIAAPQSRADSHLQSTGVPVGAGCEGSGPFHGVVATVPATALRRRHKASPVNTASAIQTHANVTRRVAETGS